METKKMSEKEFGELFSAAYDEMNEEPPTSESDMSEFFETLTFFLVLTIDKKTGIKVNNQEILHQLMMTCMSEEITQNREKFSAALFERLKISHILLFSQDSASVTDK